MSTNQHEPQTSSINEGQSVTNYEASVKESYQPQGEVSQTAQSQEPQKSPEDANKKFEEVTKSLKSTLKRVNSNQDIPTLAQDDDFGFLTEIDNELGK